MTNEPKLKPCPFCGEVPEFPHGMGTQYDIECNCGMARSGVQICDLMTIEERVSCPTLNKENNWSYPHEYVERAKQEVIKQWNTRTEVEKWNQN